MVTHDAIEQYLHNRDLRFFRDEDGDFMVFIYAPSGDPLGFNLSIDAARHIYTITGSNPRPIPIDNWPRLLGLINEHHCQSRWPKCCIYNTDKTDSNNQPVGLLSAEHHVLDFQLVEPDALEIITDITIRAIFDFFEWIKSEFPNYAT